MKIPEQLTVVFYKTSQGNEPVRDWLKELTKEDKKVIGEDIKTVQYGWPLGMPLVRSLGQGLWEIRSKLKSRKIARLIFFMYEKSIVLLHGFVKKSQKTQNDDIKLALMRKREIVR